jgi:hypothetical protein
VGIFFAGYIYYQVGLHIDTLEYHFVKYVTKPIMALFGISPQSSENTGAQMYEDCGISFDQEELRGHEEEKQKLLD